MELIALRNVKDIQNTGKDWLEGVLGQDLRDDQQVFIMILTPDVVPDDATRKRAAEGIQQVLADVDAQTAASDVTQQEIDETVDEALQHVRRHEV